MRFSSSSFWELAEAFKLATTTQDWVLPHRWDTSLPVELSPLWLFLVTCLSVKSKKGSNIVVVVVVVVVEKEMCPFTTVHTKLHQQQLVRQTWGASTSTDGHNDLVAHCFYVCHRGALWRPQCQICLRHAGKVSKSDSTLLTLELKDAQSDFVLSLEKRQWLETAALPFLQQGSCWQVKVPNRTKWL